MRILNYLATATLAISASLSVATADETLSGAAAIAELSGKTLRCSMSSGGVDLEFTEASSDGRSVSYKGYFKGRYIQGEFLVNNSDQLIRKDGQLSRQVKRLSSGKLEITGQDLPDTTCKAR